MHVCTKIKENIQAEADVVPSSSSVEVKLSKVFKVKVKSN